MYTSPVLAALEAAFSSYPIHVSPTLSPPNRNGGGDFQCNSVLQLAGRLKTKPIVLADEIAARLELSGIADVTVTGPGYLNFKLLDGYVEEQARLAVPRGFVEKVSAPKRIVIDFGSNDDFERIVGHLRRAA